MYTVYRAIEHNVDNGATQVNIVILIALWNGSIRNVWRLKT